MKGEVSLHGKHSKHRVRRNWAGQKAWVQLLEAGWVRIIHLTLQAGITGTHSLSPKDDSWPLPSLQEPLAVAVSLEPYPLTSPAWSPFSPSTLVYVLQ